MKLVNFLLCLAVIGGCFGKRPTITTGLEGKPLPSFNLLLMDSITRLNTNNIPSGNPIVLFLFNPHCPYCRAQTGNIIDEIKSFSNIRFYFLSPSPFDPIKQFKEHYQLQKYSNITVGQDYDNYFGNYYKAHGVPYIAIFNKDKRLKLVLMGEVSTNVIKDIAIE